MFSSSVIIPIIWGGDIYTSNICVIPHLQCAIAVLTPISVVVMSGFHNIIAVSPRKSFKTFCCFQKLNGITKSPEQTPGAESYLIYIFPLCTPAIHPDGA